MRILPTTLVLACFSGPPLAHAQHVPKAPDPALRAEPAALLPTFTPPVTITGHRTRALEGAVVGFAVGAAATIILTRSGGSTSWCDRSDSQDAMNSRECLGLAVAGGLAGAGVGALIGSRIRVSALQTLLPPHSGQGRHGSRLVIAAVSIVALPD